MLQKSAAQLLVPAIRNGIQSRCQSVVAGPPLRKGSMAERVFLGGGMILATMIIPAWVLVHMKDYRGGAK